MRRRLSAWLLFVGVGIGFVLVLSRNQVRLEQQAAALRREERLASERQRLLLERATLETRQVSRDELSRLVADRAEVQALRAHLASLRQPARPDPVTAPVPFSDSRPVIARAWAYAGNSTPRTALMSVLWTASHGEVDRLADLIDFSGPTRGEAEAFFAQLPLTAQQEYGSPERVVATLLAGNFPKDAAAATYEGGGGNADNAYAALTIDHSASESRTNVYTLNLTSAGWRLQIPSEVLAGYEKTLQGDPVPGDAASTP